jgi:hypothetical protein
MVTPAHAITKYGKAAADNKHLTLWQVPQELRVGKIPSRIYCNKDLIAPLTRAFRNLIQRGLVNELKTWDGCFNIRQQRGATAPSLHSWAIAIDVNAAENGLGKTPKLSPEFVACFTDAGFHWGGTWKRKDGMHFQLASI